MARLAASYLLAGDVETARRYVNAARELLDGGAAGGWMKPLAAASRCAVVAEIGRIAV